MIRSTVSMEVITTRTEAEALLLEANLIKRFKPRYNISCATTNRSPISSSAADQASPQIAKHRGAQTRKGGYFGPFACAWRGEPDRQRAAARVPAALLLRQRLRKPHAAVPAVPDQALLGALHAADLAGGLRASWSTRPKTFLGGKTDAVQRKLDAQMEEAAREAGVRARREVARPASGR